MSRLLAVVLVAGVAGACVGGGIRMRKTYEESCAVLAARQLLEGPVPPLPARMPAFDDEVLGVSFFRTEVSGEDLSGLSLPRTFIGRSLVSTASFAGTDLSESRFCWSDFVTCDFTGASLRGADLRASAYDRCSFEGADLEGADLRRSRFMGCSFRGARMAGARVSKGQVGELGLDSAQMMSVSVQPEGDEPPGG